MIPEIISIIVAIMTIAAISIGIKCQNDSKKSGSSKNFLIFMLVMNILTFIAACAKLYIDR